MPLQNVALRYQVLLEGLKTGEARKFAQVVQDIGAAFTEWTAALDSGKLTQYTRKEYEKALGVLNVALKKKLADGGTALLDEAANVGDAAAKFEASSLTQLVDNADIALPSKRALTLAMFDRPLSANGQKVAEFVNGWLDKQPDKVKQFAERAYANGLTVQEMVQGLRGTRRNNYKDGLLATTTREAEAIARTTVQHVASAARGAVWTENTDVVVGYRFVATLDSRTTDVCRALDSRVFAVGEGPTPPLHINCRSTTVAVVDPALGLDKLDKGATRSAEFGPVPAGQSYYDWLKTQPADFQDEVLGPARGALFRDGGLNADEFAALQLDKNFRPLTLDEMRAIEPVAFEKAGLGRMADNKNGASLDKLPTIPREGSDGRTVWEQAAKLAQESGGVPTVSQVLEFTRAKGISDTIARNQFSRWKVSHLGGVGVRDVAPPPVVVSPAKMREALAAKPWTKTVDYTSADNARERALEHNDFPAARAYSAKQQALELAGRLEILGVPVEKRATFSYGTLTGPVSAELAENLAQAKKWVEALIDPAVFPQDLSVLVEPGQRAHYKPKLATIRIDANESASVILHEITHDLEERYPAVFAKTRAFLLRRAEGQKALQMPGYEPGEMAYKDKWVERGGSLYSGKTYERDWNGQTIVYTYSELLTVGIQRLVKEAEKFAQEDPDYFDFVVSIFRNL